MTLDDTDLASLNARGPVCHGYANGCVCERCADREQRTRVLWHDGVPNAAAEARKQSDDYFARPWAHALDPDKPEMPPTLLTGATSCQT